MTTALVLGGTGQSGKRVIEELRLSDHISKIIMINRRQVELPDGDGKDKVEQKIVDFDALDEHKEAFNEAQIAFCCLGTTLDIVPRGKAGKAACVKVDHDYVVNSAKILKEIGTCTQFHLMSSGGNLFPRVSPINSDTCLV